jgi:SAM-dependent methyltransferase
MDQHRAYSFGSVAEQYDAYRPSPPPALAETLGSLQGLDVLEIAAGTGLVTRFLLSLGAMMTVIEPDDDMRAVLVRKSPHVTALGGVAEALPFDDASFDLVVTSSAWHWFRQPDATQEIARVLRDETRLLLLANGFDRRERWLSDLLALREPDDQSDVAKRAHEADDDLTGTFVDVEAIMIPWTWTRSHEQMVRLFSTYSGVITMPTNQREEAEGLVRGRLRAHTTSDTFDVPMAMRGLRAIRPARSTARRR